MASGLRKASSQEIVSGRGGPGWSAQRQWGRRASRAWGSGWPCPCGPSVQDPDQKPGRSAVTWIGRPAGDRSSTASGTRPSATLGWVVGAVELLGPDADATAGRRRSRRPPPGRWRSSPGRARRRSSSARRWPRRPAGARPARRPRRGRPATVARPGGGPATRRRAATRASSSRSGHGSPRKRRAKPARSWSVRAAVVQPNRPRPSSRTRSRSAAVVGGPAAAGPTARAEHERAEAPLGALLAGRPGAFQASAVVSAISAPATASTSASSRAAARRTRSSLSCGAGAGQVGDDEERLGGQRVVGGQGHGPRRSAAGSGPRPGACAMRSG